MKVRKLTDQTVYLRSFSNWSNWSINQCNCFVYQEIYVILRNFVPENPTGNLKYWTSITAYCLRDKTPIVVLFITFNLASSHPPYLPCMNELRLLEIIPLSRWRHPAFVGMLFAQKVCPHCYFFKPKPFYMEDIIRVNSFKAQCSIEVTSQVNLYFAKAGYFPLN